MHYSGIIVSCNPTSIEACAVDLRQHPGVDVYMSDPDTGRIVVVLETETLPQQEDGLRAIQNLPHVRAADLVYHHFGDADDVDADWHRAPTNPKPENGGC
jgi:nitrate reductase NapAB chaperone NapD